MIKLTNKEFINKANIIHGEYDYSLTKYINSRTKIIVKCKKHGIFNVLPQVHLRGSKCALCVNNNIKYTKDVFIEKANQVHKNKYDYSLVNYINNSTNVKINCKKHGIFEQSPNSHLSGNGCIKCSGLKKMTTDEFIEKANNIHKYKYDYSLVNYINNHTKIIIICKKHGIFEQRPINHLINKHNCPSCSGVKKLNTVEFIKRSNKIHNNFYDYSECNYINYESKIKIICPIHGEFNQTPHLHLRGGGCPSCRESSGEKIIRCFLLKNDIKFEYNKKFNDCKYKSKLLFDFYISELNCAIEFDGYQHEKSFDFFGGDEDFKKRKIRDNIKNEYCEKNNIKLIRINNLKLITKTLKNNLKL